MVRTAAAGRRPPPARISSATFRGRVMIPAYARPAHRRLRQKLAEMAEWNETSDPNEVIPGDRRWASSPPACASMHVREAAPDASVLKLGMTYPLPLGAYAAFAASVERCVVIEEGDPYLVEQLRAAGHRRRGQAGDVPLRRTERGARAAHSGRRRTRPSRAAAGQAAGAVPGLPAPQRLHACCKKLDCIVAGDIGCYSLGVLPPFEAMDTLVCMGAGIGVGLGLRHVLPPEEARRVVSVIGDSTFVHSGITGLVEMVYNPPPTGHVVMILDNGTTAMTGMQEHPGTGRTLDHERDRQGGFRGSGPRAGHRATCM